MSHSTIMKTSVKLLHATPESLIVHAGRHSYQSFEKANELSDAQLLRHFANQKEGPLKFSFAMFDVECSYAAHAHYARHTFLVQNWLSQRYAGSVGVIVPEGLDEQQAAAYVEAMAASQRAYDLLRELGAKKQDARYVQGQGVVIRGSVAGNAMAFMDILKLRRAKKAMPESRRIADLIHAELTQAWPTLFPVEDEQ